MTFTKERLQEIAEDGFLKHGESKELARIVLAALTDPTEPVYQYRIRNGYNGQVTEWQTIRRDQVDFVLKAQPHNAEFQIIAPPAPVVPEEWKLQDAIDFIEKYTPASEEEAALFAWNACRAAMLQGNHRDLSYPVDPQIAAYEKIMEQAIPDGYALVPVEPTEDMVIAGFEAELSEEFRDPDAWETYEGMSGCEQAALRAKWCWAAMVKAAPQQEDPQIKK